jgi:hypothetical protein
VKAAFWMAVVALGVGLGATAVFGASAGAEIVAGLAAPLLTGSGSAAVTERTHRLDPQRVLPLLMTAFVVKMLFFGAYVAVMLSVVGLQPLPFALTFVAAFIVLHVIEALQVRRLSVDRNAWSGREPQ